eukprot:238029-Chlamydomonas_euryale.AAC.17
MSFRQNAWCCKRATSLVHCAVALLQGGAPGGGSTREEDDYHVEGSDLEDDAMEDKTAGSLRADGSQLMAALPCAVPCQLEEAAIL